MGKLPKVTPREVVGVLHRLGFVDDSASVVVHSMRVIVMKLELKPATERDVAELKALDHLTRVDDRRVHLIERSVADGSCILAQAGEPIAGYAVLSYSFF